ncbi:dihydroxy-acid dehydratase [uncultured Desulfosarcina sp.]|uniref:dihydroxy-acid dehydratase domain-containing protein n=1 Tax=uncultured Desulfosarcina sp. TaxID=218289 RepID=UPI0029C68E8C|nr:dihydroxy-acid dehydratase [uncultured Desulfosarcina sp.]
MKSDDAKKGIERAPHWALFKAIGYTDEEIKRPLIGIANAVNTAIPGHVHLNTLARAVKAGIYIAGGTPVEFGTIGVCDGIAIDIPAKTVSLKVSDDEFNRRLAGWQAPEPKIRHGYMARYARQVSSASQGAIVR